MPELYGDSMLASEAEALLLKLRPALEEPYQLAVETAVGNLRAFAALVDLARKVRAAQKRYFAACTTEALQTSRELERKLDAMLKG